MDAQALLLAVQEVGQTGQQCTWCYLPGTIAWGSEGH